ncbi:MAG TPA: DUF1549 and DUF1553 domain-containing protein [Bryobacteraceae bacterium]|nr:DUF1549 and DUF1553 domain-containing protein [Bryobacteraceae bacterium]
MKSPFLAILLSLAAVAETSAPLGTYTAVERRHWAFQKRATPPIPQFPDAADRAWVKNPIDSFVLARLQKEGLSPAPEASRRTLIRRASFTLRGLPPTPEEIREFEADKAGNAWEKVVDRYLASPQYGERWARHWLDVVRYSETDGFEYDTHRNGAWRFRDYVVRSLNEDKPYDRFVLEQLAGDELDAKAEGLRVASGLQRLGPLRKNAGNQEVASSRSEVLTEMTNIVGAAFLGVTIGCARCHDHKFDAFRQADYYRIQAYFAATHEKDIPLASAEEQAAWKAKAEKMEADIKAVKALMKGKDGDELAALEKKVEAMTDQLPPPLPALFSVENDFQKATPIHILERGEYTLRKEKVGARPLGVLLPDGAPERMSLPENPRTKLAEWVVDAENPLTARVMANRLWYWNFGRGIVATPNDFGKMGLRPTHPELLDWLANAFVASGWKIKAMQRLMLLSSTWKQSYDSPAFVSGMEKDPENKLFWHGSRRRLDAEEIRDTMLAVSGRLNTRMGGPSVIVPVDKELTTLLYKPSQWAVTQDRGEHDRRSIYLIAKRNLRLPMMDAFDAPDMQISCARRESSTHAPQALELTNGDFANAMAESFADRLRREAGSDGGRIADRAWELAAGRAPTAAERSLAQQFLAGGRPLREFALAVLNLNAFVYVE